MPELRVLAFDFGLKHIGIATGQSITGTATGLTTVEAVNGKPDWGTLDALIADWRPTDLIVGLPLNMDDTESDMSAHARRFADRLRGRYAPLVHLHDERLTTRAAMETEGGVHEQSAVLIAEGWMEQQRIQEGR